MNNLFHDDVDSFREAVLYTSRKTGFNEFLVEKDYYCSLILYSFSKYENSKLVFKGGTLLNKAYSSFYRLSEDLDFTLPTKINLSRKERSNSMTLYKLFFNQLPDIIKNIKIEKVLTGSNNSIQYNGELSYKSCFELLKGRILFEVGLREETIESPAFVNLNTLLIDPYLDKTVIPLFSFKSLSLKEAYAEKIRATLTRSELAVRDIYDIYYAIENRLIDFQDDSLISLAVKKILVQGIEIVDLPEERKKETIKYLDLQLKPVLRYNDYEKFDFNKAWDLLIRLKNIIKSKLN